MLASTPKFILQKSSQSIDDSTVCASSSRVDNNALSTHTVSGPTSYPSSTPKEHHVRQELCTTRPPYRSGRALRAVKVYTCSQESRYLLVLNIPAVGAVQELIKLFALYGAIDEYRMLDDYPAPEQFTDVMWIKFTHIRSARYAKRKMDDYNFFGGALHVCYAPEYETIDDTRQKLVERRKEVARRIRLLANPEGEKSARSQSQLGKNASKINESAAVSVKDRLDAGSSRLQSLPIQGPALPVEVDRKRKAFHSSETGDSSYDHTVKSVRNKVSTLSTPFVPRSLKKLKKS